MVSSSIITPGLFIDPDSENNLLPESGVEDTFKSLFIKVDNHFWVNKADNSDGVIRYLDEKDNLIFWGIQECKLAKTARYFEQLTQSLVYIYLRIKEFPQLKDTARLVFLPNEKYADIVYIDDIINSDFWWQFCFFYEDHYEKRYISKTGKTVTKGSASNFYSKSLDVRALIEDYAPRFRRKHIDFGEEYDFKNIVEDILNNCL